MTDSKSKILRTLGVYTTVSRPRGRCADNALISTYRVAALAAQATKGRKRWETVRVLNDSRCNCYILQGVRGYLKFRKTSKDVRSSKLSNNWVLLHASLFGELKTCVPGLSKLKF